MLAVTNAEVHPAAEAVIHDGTILIEDGEIRAVGSGVQVPPGAEVIDAGGCPVTPGLVEPHAHVGMISAGFGFGDSDVNETTDPVTSHVRAIDGLNPQDEGFSDFALGGITTALVLPGSANVLGGTGVIIKTRRAKVVDDLVLRENGGMKAALGENPKNAHGKQNERAPKTRMGSAAIMREWLRRAAEYADNRADDGDDAKYDARLEALIPVVRGRIPLRIHAHRADDIVTATRIAGEFDLDYTIEHTTQGKKIAGLLAREGVSCAVGPCMSSESKVELEGVGYDTPAALEGAGARYCLTTDHPVVRGLYLHMLAGVLSAHGVPADAALRSVTLSAAEHIGLGDRLGSLEVGKDADVVIWNGDPLDGRSRPKAVIIEGEVTYEAPDL